MTQSASLPVAYALAACAVFDTFDREVLRAVLGIDDETMTQLLRCDAVEPLLPMTNTFRLRPADAARLLRELRHTHPRTELTLHQRAFSHYVERLRAPAWPPHHDLVEAACMHHLCRLRDLNLDYRQWDQVASMIATVRAVTPALGQRSLDQLTLCDADEAIRRQDYQAARTMLDALLERPDLAAELRAKALVAQGFLEMSRADFEHALASFAQARQVALAAGDYAAYAGALINESWIYNELLQFKKALRLSKASLVHYHKAHDLYGAAYALYSIGNNALYLGNWELAQRRLDQARQIYVSAGMLASLAMVDWALGYMYQMLGEEQASQDAYLRALEIATSPAHRSKVTEADTLTQLGLLYQIQADWSNSAAAFTAAIELAKELDEDHRCAMLLHRKGLLCVQQGDVRQGLSLLTESIERIERLRGAMTGEDLKLGLLGTAQQAYESIVLAHLEQGDPEASFSYVERARARAFLDLLAQRDSGLDDLPQYQPVALHQLQQRLSPGELVLEYYTVGVIPPGEYFLNKIPESNRRLRSLLVTPPEILLFAVTADSMTVHRIAFNPNNLPSPTADAAGLHMLTDGKLRWLYTTLLSPVESLLADARVVYIAPHGPLHYVPFAALRRPGGDALLAPAGPALVYAPSATVLCTCRDRVSRTEGRMLALGYNDDGAAGLRYAELEADLLSRLVNWLAYTGPALKSEQLLRLGPELRALHIAGHAVYTSRDPLGSYLLLGDGDRIDARTLMHRLRLNSTLVTLNACTTGLSQVASGDELLGLPRAFLYAGAATIVCSLHEVDDLAAFVLMHGFFKQLARGLSPALALHQAQLWLKTLRRDEVEVLLQEEAGEDPRSARELLSDYDPIPFEKLRFWAPFVVIGKP